MRAPSIIGITLAVIAAVVFASPAFPDATEEFHKTYAIHDDATVTVKNISGTISIGVWDKPQADVLAVKRTHHGASELKRVDIVVGTAGGLDIRTDYKNSSGDSSFWGHLFGWRSSPDVSVDITIKLPRSAVLSDVSSVSGNIIVDTSRGSGTFRAISGDIRITGVQGSFEMKTVSGGITANRSTPESVSSTSGNILLRDVGGNCAVHTVSGDMRIERAAGEVSVESTSGDIDVSAVSVRSASSVSGDIRIAAGSMTGPMKMSSISGDIDFSLPASTNANISLHTTSGDIENQSDLAIIVTSMSKKALSGKFGTGGPEIHVKTVSGDITIEK